MRKMRLPLSYLLTLLILCSANLGFIQAATNYSRDDFSSEFVFGAGTSAYQYEGAFAEDGRSPSIWDSFTHSGEMTDGSNADVSADGYHKYKEDVKLMRDTSLEAYRFSISWSRLVPNGRGAVNLRGLAYYNDLIDELVENGIQPHVTICHLDLPQILQDEYGGWLSPKIIDDFKDYADVCFRNFGNRVSHWTTLAEPNVIGQAAYDIGIWPPERCSYPFGLSNCSAGDSTVEPYIAVHNMLLAHAEVVNLYRTKYQGYEPSSVWRLPKCMKENAGQRLPSFTESQAKQVKGSFDFIGLNHYTTAYVKDSSDSPLTEARDYINDMFATIEASRDETNEIYSAPFVPTHTVSDPAGLQKMLEYVKRTYRNPPIYIHENGCRGLGVNDTLNDTERINYLSGYIGSMLSAIRDGSDVRGYFMWSFLDQFEVLFGYEAKYGLYYVDFEDDDRKRQPRLSAKWYTNFLSKKNDISMMRADTQILSRKVQ